MSNYSDIFNYLDGYNETKTFKMSKTDNLYNKLTDNNCVLINNKSVSLSTGQPIGNGVFTNIGGNKSATNSTVSSLSAFAPVLVTAEGLTIEEGAGVAVELIPGAVKSMVSGAVLKATSGLVSHPGLVMAVAAIGAFSLTWSQCDDICEKLREIHFDWGPDSTETHVVTYIVNTGLGIKTFFQHDLVQRLYDAMVDLGVFEAPSEVQPIEPVIGQATVYDFANRFPNIPDQYVNRVQKLINNFNLSLSNKYVHVAIAADGNIWLSVFSSNNINVYYRDAMINTGGMFLNGTMTSRIGRGGSSLLLNQYEITTDGVMTHTNKNQDAWLSPITMYSGNIASVIYDNFGSSYRELSSSGAIGQSTSDLGRIIIDDNAVSIEGTLADTFPDWWSQRVGVSKPYANDWVDGVLSIPGVNVLDDCVPLSIAVDKYITENPSITQAISIAGTSQGAVLDDAIALTRDAIIRGGSDTKPDENLPSITPTPPIIPADYGVTDTEMISIYNPSKAQLSQFSDAIWGFDWTDIKKLFTDPMQAIIALNVLYANPIITGTSNIVVGSWDSGVSANKVSNQYITIDCGSVTINPYYNNVHDYKDTNIQCYLPFIGIVDLNVYEVMGKTLNIKYNVDVLTGTCLAMINISSSNGNYTGYTFNGNCAVQLPLTGANYSSFVTGGLGVIASVGAAALTKNPSAGAIAGAGLTSGAAAISTANLQVTRSGSLGGNAGAMGIKIPYIIITRNIAIDAVNKQHFEGLPQSLTSKLNALSGFTRIKEINLDGLTCTETEKDMILNKLKEGVFI